MSAFILSIAVGLYSADKISPLVGSFQDIDYQGLVKSLRTEWQRLQKKKTIIFAFSIFLITILLLWVTQDLIFSLIESVLIELDGNRESFLGRVFGNFAANATSIPITSYISKSILIAKRTYYFYIAGGLSFFLLQTFRLMPNIRTAFWRQIVKPLLIDLNCF